MRFYDLPSNYKYLNNYLIEIQCIETATYSNKAYFPGEHFYIFEKLNNQCKVEIIFIKSFNLNGKTEFYDIILILLENFLILLRIFFYK